MSENQSKKTNKKVVIIGAIALAALLVVLGIVSFLFREKPVEGAKSITIEVIDNVQDSQIYEVNTDAEYLRQAMEEAKGLEFSGTESSYGLMIETVNGVTPDFNVDNAFWKFMVNGADCMYGVDTQPVEDGDAFVIVYEVFIAE